MSEKFTPLELMQIEVVSERISEKVFEKLGCRFVTREQALYGLLSLLTFLFLSYLGLTWKNPTMIQNLKQSKKVDEKSETSLNLINHDFEHIKGYDIHS